MDGIKTPPRFSLFRKMILSPMSLVQNPDITTMFFFFGGGGSLCACIIVNILMLSFGEAEIAGWAV